MAVNKRKMIREQAMKDFESFLAEGEFDPETDCLMFVALPRVGKVGNLRIATSEGFGCLQHFQALVGWILSVPGVNDFMGKMHQALTLEAAGRQTGIVVPGRFPMGRQ